MKLPIIIQNARVKIASASHGGTTASLDEARQELRSAAATAKKLGYYRLECDARLSLAELESRTAPTSARTRMAALASEARSHGLELFAHQAELISSAGTTLTASNPSRP